MRRRKLFRISRRVTALLLCLCMITLTASSIGASAAKTGSDRNGEDDVCSHVHDEICGYDDALSDNGIRMMSVADSSGATVEWGDITTENVQDIVQTDEQIDGGYVRTWDVSKTTKRYLDVPLQINVASNEDIKITLPRYITENIHSGSSYKAEVATDAVDAYCEDIIKNDSQVTLDFRQGLGHNSFTLWYKFDCWNVKSGTLFTVNYTIQVGSDETNNTLNGMIKTGFGFEIVNDFGYYPDSYYSNAYGRDNGYSLNSLGGADRIMSYIQNCSSVYEKYFNVEKFNANPKTNKDKDEKDGYIYDIAPFFVKPSGQQPYDISGTVTVEHGEILAGVYMMDSRLGSKAPWKLLTDEDNDNKNGTFDFRFNHDEKFENEEDGSLIDKVVTGNLTEKVDNRFYTLYFLVRYKISELTDEQKRKVNQNSNPGETAYILNANIDLKHTGVDSEVDMQKEKEKDYNQTLYKGPITAPQIYDAYYTYYVLNQQDALSLLDTTDKANLDFEADFFCFNEAREDYDEGKNDKYRLEAVIDLLYLTENRPYEKSEQLKAGDYKFSQLSLSLVDAPGSWSQNWYYENRGEGPTDDEVWNERRPNIGWPVETWNQSEFKGYSDVIVYGSKSHEGNDWDRISSFDVQEIWAKDKGRDVGDSRFGDGEEKSNQLAINTGDYVRLKVVYDSRYTTALRLRYQIELKEGILNQHKFLKSGSNHGLTSWFNYFGYTKQTDSPGTSDSDWYADTTNMNIDAHYKSDADWNYNWEDDNGEEQRGDRGSIEQARKYDNDQSQKVDFASKFNTQSGRYETGYSMRDYVRIFLGRSNDMAGMLLTQALYDSSGIVGNNANSTQLNSGSFSKEKTVTDVSEIVYSISGGITNGYLNKDNLDSRRKKEKTDKSNSPYTSLKMRYYVLLPAGFKLNDKVVPHYTSSETEYLSATPSFYNDQKATGREDFVVVTSNSNIPAWQEESANGALSEMKWNEAGSVKLNTSLSNDRLVVFDRTLEDQTYDEVFNLHGATETYFWGRGLTFSVVPIEGTGKIRTGKYETQVWCQYLGDDGQPLSLAGFNKDIDGEGGTDVKAEDLNNSLNQNGKESQKEDTLLYIPSDFNNISPVGTAGATITLESEVKDENNNPIVQFEKPYDYKLDFSSPDRKDNNVVLWTNIEQEYNSKPQYRGTVTGVDLDSLPEKLKKCVKVYVSKDFFNPTEYVGVGTANAANPSWLTDNQHGWTEVSENDLESYDWSTVKAVAFYFENFVFNQYDQYGDDNASDIESAIVKINMIGPKREGEYLELDGKQEKTFDAVSRLYLSDTQDGDKSGCAFANEVPVGVTVRPIILPETGGIGTMIVYLISGLAVLIGSVVVVTTMRKRRVSGNGQS